MLEHLLAGALSLSVVVFPPRARKDVIHELVPGTVTRVKLSACWSTLVLSAVAEKGIPDMRQRRRSDRAVTSL